jgi:hypothetical protein
MPGDHHDQREIWAEVGVRLSGLGEAVDFARAAEREPELARQLPRFVSEVRRIFEADEIRFHLGRLEREQEAQELVSHDAENFDEDEVFSEDSETSAARARSFILIKQLLLAPQPGTS